MTFRLARLTGAFLALTILTGCEQSTAPEKPQEAESQPAAAPEAPAPEPEKLEIAWFKGGVQEAFALAKAENKPLFLYWGAVWCPPCVEIKATVFKSPQFIAQSRLFIPLYLDGDTARAQIYGDKFGTKVYPTLIVFNPEGEEVTRLNAGMELSAYNTVLELSLDSMRPTGDLVEAAMEDPALLTDAELQQLASYSWYDNAKALPEGTPPELFKNLSEAAGENHPKAAARFYLQYLVMLADSEEEFESADPAPLDAILADPDLLFASWDYLTAYPDKIIAAVEDDETETAGLRYVLVGVVLKNRHNENLSTTKQMAAWNTYFALQAGEDEELPAEIIDDIRADGIAAERKTAGTHERQSVIDSVYSTYLDAGLVDEARALLKAEIETSKTPYYFMSALAELEEQEGNMDLAVDWRRKAYENSTGPATRIRWWARYTQAVVRMVPDNPEAIDAAAMVIFSETDLLAQIFAGANFRNLQNTTNALQGWDEEFSAGQSKLGAYHAAINSLCSVQAPGSSAYVSCRSLLP